MGCPDVAVVMLEPETDVVTEVTRAYVQRWWIRLCCLWIWNCMGRTVDVPTECGCVKGADFSICGTNGGGAGTSANVFEVSLGKHDRRTHGCSWC